MSNSQRRKKVDQLRLQFAAHLFVFTTRDGMIISQLKQISPFKLDRWSQTPDWKKALEVWRHKGSSEIEGEEFKKQVQLSHIKRSMKEAGRLWRELFGITANKKDLSRSLGSEFHAIQEQVDRRHDT